MGLSPGVASKNWMCYGRTPQKSSDCLRSPALQPQNRPQPVFIEMIRGIRSGVIVRRTSSQAPVGTAPKRPLTLVAQNLGGDWPGPTGVPAADHSRKGIFRLVAKAMQAVTSRLISQLLNEARRTPGRRQQLR